MANLEARFWPKVQRTDGCWLWTAALFPNGYGCIADKPGPAKGTHRVAWELTNGPIPAGMFVLHRCDNRRCVRPDHLFLGTQRDNMRDRNQKQRGALPTGSAHHWAKYGDETVAQIRALAATGMTFAAISREVGVSRPHVSRLVRHSATRR